MGAKKKKAEHGDRVRWINDQGDWRGTIIDLHANKTKGVAGPNFGVLPDDGPARVYPWPKVECIVLNDRPARCPRCGVAGHRAQSCPTEYLAWKARKKQELALEARSIGDPSGWDVDF